MNINSLLSSLFLCVFGVGVGGCWRVGAADLRPSRFLVKKKESSLLSNITVWNGIEEIVNGCLDSYLQQF